MRNLQDLFFILKLYACESYLWCYFDSIFTPGELKICLTRGRNRIRPLKCYPNAVPAELCS